MSRFYLNIRNGSGYTADEEGVELPALEDARVVAIQGARSILSEELLGGAIDLRGRIEVADENRRVVMIVRFDEAVAVLTGALPGTEGG